ncbi:gastrula zinc finger protein XlCGF17.1-like [Leguminivora glycinivorella]|uniref:gastrula zinc finger protein XlCGF17.1-like n=1 Tax=Leguminivora glycinivorella TaxID=1035111 RepID=UPI0020108E36|nr:gastrula zinc finger protein XlCGF17.1-like [Leguminivora glycinivorella]
MASTYYILKLLQKKRMARKLRNHSNRNLINSTQTIKDNTSSDIFRCRVCLKEGRIPIFGDESCRDISEDISLFGDIVITKEDSHPQYLCDACNALLDAAILFRRTAKESETLLMKGLENKTDAPFDVDNYDHEINSDEVPHNDEYETQLQPVKSYTCKLCKKSFRTSEEYSRHRSSREHKNVRIQCSICNRLLTAQLYKKHLARHQTASHLICEVCGKLYRKDNLIRHLQLHSFDLPFQCQVCPYRGRFIESLRIHMRTHTGDKPFSCDKCELRFLTRSNLNRHLLTHRKERPFKCTECGRGFYTKCDMDVHFKSDHVGIKDFGCRMCGSKYGTRKALMRHELRVHKRDKMAKGRVPLYLQSGYRKQSDECV